MAPSVLVTARLTRGSASTADVAVLSVALSSGIAAGPATVAVLESVPVNVDASVAVAVIFHIIGTLPVLVTGLLLFAREGLRWKDVTAGGQEEGK